MFLNTKTRTSRLRRGASLTEFGLLVGLIAVVSIAAIQASGNRVSSLLNTVGTELSGVSNTVADATPASASPSGGGNAGNPDSDGAFVLTSSTWTGDLGGVSGAHAKCVTELKNNDWRNKSDFSTTQLNGARAFICDSNDNCGDPVANKTYTMAVAGDTTLGGHQFTTDSDARGPGDTKNWSDSDAFGTSTMYWEKHTKLTEKWVVYDTYINNAEKTSLDWSSYDGQYIGRAGETSHANFDRWMAGKEDCNVALPLVCIVD